MLTTVKRHYAKKLEGAAMRVSAHRSVVLFVNLDCLVGLGSEESATTHIKQTLEDAGLAVQRPWLHRGLVFLEVVASLPVPEVKAPIVPCSAVHKARTLASVCTQ